MDGCWQTSLFIKKKTTPTFRKEKKKKKKKKKRYFVWYNDTVFIYTFWHLFENQKLLFTHIFVYSKQVFFQSIRTFELLWTERAFKETRRHCFFLEAQKYPKWMNNWTTEVIPGRTQTGFSCVVSTLKIDLRGFITRMTRQW